jgi:hypothetical protein
MSQLVPAITVPLGASQSLVRESLVVMVAAKYKYTVLSVVRNELTAGGTTHPDEGGACVLTVWSAKVTAPSV